MTPDHHTSTRGSQADLDNAQEEMDRLEGADEVPSDPRDWPGGRAKFLTFGGGDDGDRYGEGVTAKLGPAEVAHLQDGSVSVGGELVDNPEDFRGLPIPGGPTDPDSPAIAGVHNRGDQT
jgi:hypothetical protein